MQEYIEEHFQLDNENKKNLIIFLFCFFPKEIIVKSNNDLLIITLIRYYKNRKTEYIVDLANTIEFKEQKLHGQIYELIFIEKDKKVNIRLNVQQYRRIRNFIFQCMTANNIKLTVLKSK